MRVKQITVLASGLVWVCFCTPALAQSVADAGAASRATKKSTTKTITNDDVKPTDAASDSDEDSTGPRSGKSGERFEGRAAQLRGQILALKRQVAGAQTRLERLQQVKADRESRFSAYDDREREQYYVRFKQAELQSQNAIAGTQTQLEQLKTKLADLQEQARKEGFGNSVYEPD